MSFMAILLVNVMHSLGQREGFGLSPRRVA